MPSVEKHCALSQQRTGREYRELHEWMDGKALAHGERVERHRISNVLRFLPFVEETFGKDAAREYLHHLEDDYEHTFLLRVWRTLRKVVGA